MTDGVVEWCAFEGCVQPATRWAKGRLYGDDPSHIAVARYCERHAVKVADEGWPEYHVDCPNCGCKFGVN